MPEVSGPNKPASLNQPFGRYVLVRKLGVGGMAEAFLAQMEGPGGFKKLCVIKRMLAHLADDEKYLQMFQREARVAALLTHTNVVQIFELGEVDGAAFIAMEYVDGAPVSVLARRTWHQGRSVPMEVVCCAIADAALGLAAAHTLKDHDGTPLQLVHRDISPDNLMMNKEGVTKVLDFGVAKIAASEKTATNELKGKLPFLAPEYILGKGLDARSDLYALGVTFYWLITGRRPFTSPHGNDLGLLEAIVKDTPVSPSVLNPKVPGSIEELILGLLERDPEKRPQDGYEVHDALKDVLSRRRDVVVPFIDKTLAEPPVPASVLAAVRDAPATPGFVPATPQSDGLKSDWRRKINVVAARPNVPTVRTVDPALTLDSKPPSSVISEIVPGLAPGAVVAAADPAPTLISPSPDGVVSDTPPNAPDDNEKTLLAEEPADAAPARARSDFGLPAATDAPTAPQRPVRAPEETHADAVSFPQTDTTVTSSPGLLAEREHPAALGSTRTRIAVAAAAAAVIAVVALIVAEASSSSSVREASSVPESSTPVPAKTPAPPENPTAPEPPPAPEPPLSSTPAPPRAPPSSSSKPPSSPAPAPAPPSSLTPTPAPVPDAEEPVEAPVEPVEAKTGGGRAPVHEPGIAIQLKAPASVTWFFGGKALGSGATSAKLPAGARSVAALDKRRGGRSVVPIERGVADYNALPHGKINPRARPYADVFLGKEKLGTTPFAPVDVVAGRYELRFIYNGKEERRIVEVGAGALERPAVDFGVQ